MTYLVSSVSLWEIALKLSLGKLELQGIAAADLPRIASEHDFTLCALSAETAASFDLPRNHDHRDPFDRMLVWQAMRESAVLVSRDRAMASYEAFGLRLLW